MLRTLLLALVGVCACSKKPKQEPAPASASGGAPIAADAAAPAVAILPDAAADAAAAPADAASAPLALSKAELEQLGKQLDDSNDAGAELAKLSKDQLVALAKAGPCRWAADAAEALAKAGDPSFLPHRPAQRESVDEIGRALCMIAQLEKPVALAYLREYVPAKGSITLVTDTCPQDGGRTEKRRSSSKLVGDELADFGNFEPECVSPNKKLKIESYACSNLREEGKPDTIGVSFTPDASGKLYVDEIEHWDAIACD